MGWGRISALALMAAIACAGSAQAGTVTQSIDAIGLQWAGFDALPGQFSDVTVRITDNNTVVTITDAALPLSTSLLPWQTGQQLCPLLNAHTARCTLVPSAYTNHFEAAEVNADSGIGSHVRDLPGSGGEVVVHTGPGDDDVAIRHNYSRIKDEGGVNQFTLDGGSYVDLVPGRNVVDVRNGDSDFVTCYVDHEANDRFPAPLDQAQIWNSISADPGDSIEGCGPYDQGS